MMAETKDMLEVSQVVVARQSFQIRKGTKNQTKNQMENQANQKKNQIKINPRRNFL